PDLARQHRGGLIDTRAPRQVRGFIIRIGRAIKQREDDLILRVTILNVTFPDNSFNRRERRLKRETIRSRDIEFPSEIRHGETLIDKKSIPEIPVLRRQAALN